MKNFKISLLLLILIVGANGVYSQTDSTKKYIDTWKVHLVPDVYLQFGSGLSLPYQQNYESHLEPRFKTVAAYKFSVNLRFKIADDFYFIISPTFSQLGYQYDSIKVLDIFPVKATKRFYFYYGYEAGIEFNLFNGLSLESSIGKNFLDRYRSTNDEVYNFEFEMNRSFGKINVALKYALNPKFNVRISLDRPLNSTSVVKSTQGAFKKSTKMTGVFISIGIKV